MSFWAKYLGTVWLVFGLNIPGCARDLEAIQADYQRQKQLYETIRQQVHQAEQKLTSLATAVETAEAELVSTERELEVKKHAFSPDQSPEQERLAAEELKRAYFKALQQKQASETVFAQQQIALFNGQKKLRQSQQQLEEITEQLQQLQTEKGEIQFALFRQQLEQPKTVRVRIELGCDENITLKQCREQVMAATQQQALKQGATILIDTVKPTMLGSSIAKDEIINKVNWLLISHKILAQGFIGYGGYFYHLEAQVQGQVPDDLKNRFMEGDNLPLSAPLIAVEPNQIFRHVLEIGGYGPTMVWIPAGSFTMGDTQGTGESDEQPVHSLTVQHPFAMSRNEITFAEYDQFCEATERKKPSNLGWGGWEGWWRGKRPVINVSWHDAQAYTQWLTTQTGQQYRLPTETEWEYACRAGTMTNYWWGNEIGNNQANCDGCGSQWDNRQTAPMESFACNGFGLCDLTGNVWEWDLFKV